MRRHAYCIFLVFTQGNWRIDLYYVYLQVIKSAFEIKGKIHLWKKLHKEWQFVFAFVAALETERTQEN